MSDKIDAWVDSALTHARDLLDAHAPEEPAPLHDAASAALDALEKHRVDLATLGRWSSAFALGAFSAGESDEAILKWLAQGATFEERIAAQREATRSLAEASAAREAAWASLKATLQDVGQAVLRYVLPFVVAAIAAA